MSMIWLIYTDTSALSHCRLVTHTNWLTVCGWPLERHWFREWRLMIHTEYEMTPNMPESCQTCKAEIALLENSHIYVPFKQNPKRLTYFMLLITKESQLKNTSYCLLLLLLLSRFSRVRLGATPETAACQAPSSLGFSRQEHWSGLPFPSPMQESEKWKWGRSVVSDS